MKDPNRPPDAERGEINRNDAEFKQLRADIEAGWQRVEEGKVRDFDPEAVKRRGREKLIALRAAIREGLESGPTKPLDIEVILTEARATLPSAIADGKLEARRKEPKS